MENAGDRCGPLLALRVPAAADGARRENFAGLGDASYALYLTHSLPIRALRMLWLSAGFGLGAGAWLFLALALGGAVAFAIVVHRLLERPLNSACRQWVFDTPRLLSAGA